VDVDRYGNAYNVDCSYDLDRFNKILKRKTRKSSFAEDPAFKYEDYNENYADNKDVVFMRVYDE
jgi:hypothetical protein